MSKTMTALMASGLVAGLVAFAGSASAAPVVNQQALKSALAQTATPHVESVRWYGRGGGWGYRRGWGYGGFAAGAIVGGALAPRYYYPPYYGPTYYYPPAPPPPAYYGGDDIGYCMSRFRSYDPRSGTYMGYDGRRHPCP